ncbi:MAG: 6-pyruvoyl tetrahydropterin synthase [Anaerolineae bacterium]|nr:MAG: 6-pyruvoyl tetrahydropterin synthase [Anaerolineae bacterium]
MYTLSVKRDFIARHYLIGGDWGAENAPNSHHYVLELQLSGSTLDQHGYLVDILEIERLLDETVARYREQMLNDLPEFAGLNPSIENFARLVAEQLHARIHAPNIASLTVRIWENEIAWVAYQIHR